METLHFSTTINAPREKVWKTMLDLETFKKWTTPWSPNSTYEGEWKESEHIKFLDPGRGGTKALITEFRPYAFISARHVASIAPDGTEDTESEQAKSWIGTTESYTFTDVDGKTKLDIEIVTRSEWVKMNEDGWPKALEILKELAEQ